MGTMSVAASLARSQSKKLLAMGLAIFGRGFSSSKCKTWAKMATARIKLLRNKRQVVINQMRRDVALLLESGQDATARIRVEHVIREQNMMAANEIIELFCEHIVAKLSIISKRRNCPTDLKEGISSLIFAGPRCSEIPELLALRDIFQKKYGKDFVSAATDLRPESGVNRLLIEKLSAKMPSGELKLKVMKEIAKEYQIKWDTTETEEELLKPPEERIEGPRDFVRASTLPVKATTVTTQETVDSKNSSTRLSSGGTNSDGPQFHGAFLTRLSSGGTNTGGPHFQDASSAAKAAAQSAKDAIAAAQAAARLANENLSIPHEYCAPSGNNFQGRILTGEEERRASSQRDFCESQSFGKLDNTMDTGREGDYKDTDAAENKGHYYRRHSYNSVLSVQTRHSDIKFDESDCDEEIEMEPRPFGGSGGGVNHYNSSPSLGNDGDYIMSGTEEDLASRRKSHPKLPDYDTLAARFEALKYRKSQT